MKNIPSWVWYLLGLLLLLYLLWFFKNIVVYLLAAGVISVFGRPLVNLLKKIKIGKRRMPDGFAAFFGVIVIWIIGLAFASIFIPLLVKEARILGQLNADDFISSFSGPINRLEGFLQKTEILQEQTFNELLRDRIRELIGFTQITYIFNRFANITGNIFVALGSVTFILFFFLKDENLFYNMVIAFVPEKNEGRMNLALQNSKAMLVRYLRGIALQLIIFATMVWVGLMIIRVDNPFLIAIFAGIFNIIPYIGPILGAAMGILLSVTASLPMEIYPDMFFMSLKIIAVFSVAQIIDNYISAPMIFSRYVNAHPLEIFIVILAGGMFSGIIGMFLAVPIYTVLKLIAKEFFSENRIVKDLTGER